MTAKANGKPAIHPQARFYRVKDLVVLLATSRETIARMSRDGRLPEPLYIGARSPRWPREQVDAWIAKGCPASPEAEARMREARARAQATRAANDQERQGVIRRVLEQADRGELPPLPAQAKAKEEPCPA